VDNNRLITILSEQRSADGGALLPFLTAGYPDVESTGALLEGLEARGVQICELGFPFSDPIADGPTIQASYTRVLDKGITVDNIFDIVRSYRIGGGNMALLAMVSYSIVFRRDPEKFCTDARDAGFDGLIIPDLPLEESDLAAQLAASAGLCNVMLISPTTPPDRRIQLAQASRGFVYFMSIAGITGERKQLPASTLDAVAELKNHTDIPVCIGFGISDARMVKEACTAGDGAIVGSAIIHRINDGVESGASRDEIVESVCDFVSELLAPTV